MCDRVIATTLAGGAIKSIEKKLDLYLSQRGRQRVCPPCGDTRHCGHQRAGTVAMHGTKAKVTTDGPTEHCYGARLPSLDSVRNKPANLLGVAIGEVDAAAWKTCA